MRAPKPKLLTLDTPKKTTAIAVREAASRATKETLVTTYTMAPDNTCGFISGSSDRPALCPSFLSCMWEQEIHGRAGCGNASVFLSRSRCLDAEAAEDLERCDEQCKRDTGIIKCTHDTAPSCFTFVFPSSISLLVCSDTDNFDLVLFNAVDEPTRSFSTFVDARTTGSRTDAETEISFTSQQTDATSRERRSGSTSKRPATSTASGESADNESLPIGAIVGGAVGGLAVVSLLVLGIVFVQRYSKKPKDGISSSLGPDAPYRQALSSPLEDSTQAAKANENPLDSETLQHSGVSPPFLAVASDSQARQMEQEVSDTPPDVPHLTRPISHLLPTAHELMGDSSQRYHDVIHEMGG
ncbi:hypothetical protein AK830_g8547 [Neonectria ditissima]|uniref:Uncharacterized protein n=1 Tax=Neonectria ditissima TaxID=78410 RepID=A0A0P7AU60_9HYPO|nr:hypothetical protein AK830_g8547 [Neonectria ditissima]